MLSVSEQLRGGHGDEGDTPLAHARYPQQPELQHGAGRRHFRRPEQPAHARCPPEVDLRVTWLPAQQRGPAEKQRQQRSAPAPPSAVQLQTEGQVDQSEDPARSGREHYRPIRPPLLPAPLRALQHQLLGRVPAHMRKARPDRALCLSSYKQASVRMRAMSRFLVSFSFLFFFSLFFVSFVFCFLFFVVVVVFRFSFLFCRQRNKMACVTSTFLFLSTEKYDGLRHLNFSSHLPPPPPRPPSLPLSPHPAPSQVSCSLWRFRSDNERVPSYVPLCVKPVKEHSHTRSYFIVPLCAVNKISPPPLRI